MGKAREWLRSDTGVVAPLVALCMVVLLGFVAIVVDAGLLFVERTQLQKAADAAALAGAQAIGRAGTSATVALQYARDNGVNPTTDPSTAIVANGSATTFSSGDSWVVTIQRHVPLAFAPLLGINNSTVKVSATAIDSPAKSINSDSLMPYAVWDGNSRALAPGDSVVYRDNGWIDDNVKPMPDGSPNPNWNVTGNEFKGYFHDFSGIQVDQGGEITSSSKGGNATGQEPLTKICDDYNNDRPGIFPVISSASGNGGDITFQVEGFVALRLNPIRGCGGSEGMSSPFSGTVIGWNTWDAQPGGNATSGGVTVMVLKLWR